MFSDTLGGGRDTGQWLCEAILFYFWTHTSYIVSPWTNTSKGNSLNMSWDLCVASFTLIQLCRVVGYRGRVEVQLHTFLTSALKEDCHVHAWAALLLEYNTGRPQRQSRVYGEEKNLWPCQALNPDSWHLVTFLMKLYQLQTWNEPNVI